MAVKDKSVTIKGDLARVASMQVFPQPDGSVVIIVAGVTNDSEGRLVALKEAQIGYRPGQNDLVSNLLGPALDALRKVNGLEDAPIALEPKADAAQPAVADAVKG